MGTALHFDVIEAAGDGGIARLEIEDGGVTRFRGAAGSAELAITDAGLFASDIANSAGTGPVTFREGASIATAKTLASANGATLSGDTASATILQGGDGQPTKIIAGNTATDEVQIVEGTGDGSQVIVEFDQNAVDFYRSGGALDFTMNRGALDWTFATGTTLKFANGLSLSGDTASASIIQGGDGQNLDIIAGNTAGDDIRFLEGTGDGSTLRMDIKGNGSSATYDSSANSMMAISRVSNTVPTISYAGHQVGDADGEKLYFGGTSHYLEWDTGINGLLFNGSAADFIDLDLGSIQANYFAVDVSAHCVADGGCYLGSVGGATGGNAFAGILLQGIADPAKAPESGAAWLYADSDDDTVKIEDQASTNAAVTHAGIDLVP
jgi:hypothetical protein